MISHRSLIVAVFLGVVLASPVHAQEKSRPGEVIEEIRRAYRDLDYERAEALGRQTLQEYQQLTIGELTEIHRLMGLVEISQNDRSAARGHFEAALSLDPNLKLDPTYVSPKIIDFFQEVRREYLTQSGGTVRDSAVIRYRLIPDSRPSAALRSALLPGWGQLYKGESRKGHLLMGIWGTSAAGAAVTHIIGARAEDSEEPLPEDRQNLWRGTRNGLIAVAAGTWLVSYLDALLTPQEEPIQTRRVSLAADAQMRPHVRLRIDF